jgi:hypothetical protein
MNVEIPQGSGDAPRYPSRKGRYVPVLDRGITIGNGACTPWSRSNT